MGEETHNVKWLDYSKNLLQVQRSIYLSSSMYDVVIAVGECRFKAHQLVLSASSQFFIEILQNFPPNVTPTIIIPDLNPNLIESLLVFIYCGEVYIQPSSLPEFLDCCSFFKVKGFIGCNCFINGVKLEQKKYNFDISQMPISHEKSTILIKNDTSLAEAEPSEINVSNFEAIGCSQDVEQSYESNITESGFSTEKMFVIEAQELVEEVHLDLDDQDCECPFPPLQISKHNTEEESTIQLALEELHKGKSLDQISEVYNIPKLSLYRKLRYNPDYRVLYRSIRHSVITDAVKAVTHEGLSLQQASTQFAVSKTVLWRNLKKTSLYKPEEKIHLHRNDAIAALERGESLTNISKKYNIPLSTLHRDKVRLYDQGKLPKHCKIRKRDGGPDFQNRLKAAITSCEKGISQKVASEMHNIPKTTIWRYLRHVKINDSSKILGS